MKRQNLKNLVSILAVVLLLFAPVFNALLKKTTAAPDVRFKSINGETITLQSLRGKPVLITFWATDCPACIREIPHLKELYQQFHPKGLEIIALNMYYDPPNHVVAMSKAKKLPYPVALDIQGLHAKAFGDVKLTPTTLLISVEGNIIRKSTGPFRLTDMKKHINQELLKPKQEPTMPLA